MAIINNTRPTVEPTIAPTVGVTIPVQSEAPDEMAVANAIKWLGRQLRGSREWTGRDDGRTYASIGHSGLNPGNGVHESPLDVASELIALKKGTRSFVTYKLKYGNKTVDARLISIDKTQDKLIFALDIEYNIVGAEGSVTTFSAKKEVPNAGQQTELGFGKMV